MDFNTTRASRWKPSASTKDWTVYVIGLICLFLFTISAYSKIVDHHEFVLGLSLVKYIGEYAVPISWIVPILETAVALLLLFPKTTRLGLYGFLGLMVVFTFYIAIIVAWADKKPCNCNLIVENLSWIEHLWFNVGFINLAIIALWLGKANNSKKKYHAYK